MIPLFLLCQFKGTNVRRDCLYGAGYAVCPKIQTYHRPGLRKSASRRSEPQRSTTRCWIRARLEPGSDLQFDQISLHIRGSSFVLFVFILAVLCKLYNSHWMMGRVRSPQSSVKVSHFCIAISTASHFSAAFNLLHGIAGSNPKFMVFHRYLHVSWRSL